MCVCVYVCVYVCMCVCVLYIDIYTIPRTPNPDPEPEQFIGLISPAVPIPVNMPDSKDPENSPVQQPEQV